MPRRVRDYGSWCEGDQGACRGGISVGQDYFEVGVKFVKSSLTLFGPEGGLVLRRVHGGHDSVVKQRVGLGADPPGHHHHTKHKTNARRQHLRPASDFRSAFLVVGYTCSLFDRS